MNYIEKLLAWAQVVFFTISLVGFIGILYVVVLGSAKLDPTSEKLAYTMLGVLGTIVTQQAGYFYQRHRPQALPDPPDQTPTSPPQAAKP